MKIQLFWHIRTIVLFGFVLELTILLFAEIICAPIITLLSFYWSKSNANAVYALTHLQLPQLTLFSLTVGVILLIDQNHTWWQKYWQKVIFFLPIASLYIFYLINLWHFNIFKELVKEDHLVENMQFWTLLIGGLIAGWRTIASWKRKDYWLTLLAGLITCGLLFTAGDEISWGQRIFGVETNQLIQEYNRQNENTVHNLYAVEWLVIYAYLGISIVGVFGRFIGQLIPQTRKITKFLPPYITLGYFGLTLFYFWEQLIHKGGIWQSWSEVAELALYTGTVIWTVFLLG